VREIPITKIGATLLIVGLVVGAVAGYGGGFMVYQSQISQLESDISTLQSNITALNSTLNEALANATSLQTLLSEAYTDITSLQAQLADTQALLAEAQAELTPGRLPILHVGDWWIMEFVFNETTYTWTQNVTGEGPNYYAIYSTYEPPYMGRANETQWVDKSTIISPVWIHGQSEYTYDNMTITYTYNITFFYTYYGGVPFPLIVGKEFNMTEIMTYKMTMDDTTYTYEYNMTYTYKVETIENVTVPAGTFACFKLNMWNATSGALIYTTWYSDEAKTWVKYIDYTTTPETTAELKDYSV
jgi:hypothetical protein